MPDDFVGSSAHYLQGSIDLIVIVVLTTQDIYPVVDGSIEAPDIIVVLVHNIEEGEILVAPYQTIG